MVPNLTAFFFILPQFIRKKRINSKRIKINTLFEVKSRATFEKGEKNVYTALLNLKLIWDPIGSELSAKPSDNKIWNVFAKSFKYIFFYFI